MHRCAADPAACALPPACVLRTFSSSSTRRRWSAVDSSSICRADILRDNSAFTAACRSRSARGRLLIALAARRIAIHGRQIFADLHQLILQRRRFAQQPQHILPPGLERLARAAASAC